MKKYVSAEAKKNWLKDFNTLTQHSHTFEASAVSGTIYPANNGTAIGIVFNDVVVGEGEKVAGSLMVQGHVLEKALPQTITKEAKAKLMKQGIYFYADNGEALVDPDAE